MKHIMLVDDEADVLELTVVSLRQSGFKVSSAGSAKEALSFLKQNQDVDFVITDFQMPGHTGFDLLHQIRDFSNVPVAFLTGSIDLRIEEAFDLGLEAIFRKPFDLQQVAHFIKNKLHAEPRNFDEIRKYERFSASFETSVKVQGEEVSGNLMNLARGGFFMSFPDKDGNLPKIGERVGFKISIEGQVPLILQGAGEVRWVRANDDGSLRRGVGVQITEMQPQTVTSFLELLNELKIRAYIPKN